MKKTILFTLMIIIIYSLFNINTYKDFGEIIDYNLKNNDQIFIEENFNTESTTVKVNKKDFDELIRLISASKYRKVVDYKAEAFATKYEITSNDNLKKVYFIVDEEGLALQSKGKSLKRYIIKEEKLNAILDYLENIVDKSDTKEGNVTKSDFNYIHTSLAKEISITKLLKKTNIDFKNIIITSINLSISGDGYVSSINITFFNRDHTEKFVLVYNKVDRNLKINKFESQLTDVLKETNNDIILNALDYLLKEPNELDDYRSKRLINLYKPYKTSLNHENEELYYNGKVTKDKEKTGIVFSIIDMYSSKDSYYKFHIFDEHLDLLQ